MSLSSLKTGEGSVHNSFRHCLKVTHANVVKIITNLVKTVKSKALFMHSDLITRGVCNENE